MIKRMSILVICSFLMIFAGMVSSVFASETLADSETIKQVQEALNEAGYNCGTADGIAGNKTKNAIVQYKTDKGLSDVSDSITEELLFLLGISEEPVELTKGIYRNAADELDPVIRLSETSDTLYIERDYGKEGLENIPVFSGMCVRSLGLQRTGRTISLYQ